MNELNFIRNKIVYDIAAYLFVEAKALKYDYLLIPADLFLRFIEKDNLVKRIIHNLGIGGCYTRSDDVAYNFKTGDIHWVVDRSSFMDNVIINNQVVRLFAEHELKILML